MEIYEDGTGQLIFVHERDVCKGRPCTIHNPSDHQLREYPTFWDDDRKLMYRVIDDVRVLDPDEIAYQKRRLMESLVVPNA